jgi:Calx-beta domain
MFSSFIRGAITRRGSRPTTRRAAKSRLPEVEGLEGRQLLTAYISINNPKVVEGSGVNSAMNFTVSLAVPSAVPVTVAFHSVNRTAAAGSDYYATSGTLTFAPGETTKRVPVTVIGDKVVESNETFLLALSNPTNGTIISTAGSGNIIDDDGAVAPQLTISDVTMARGLGGSKTMTFTVALNTAVAAPVTVRAATSNLTAVAGVDYAANAQTLSFGTGQRTAQFSVTIYGSTVVSADKMFLVNLTVGSVGIAKTTAAGILKYGA